MANMNSTATGRGVNYLFGLLLAVALAVSAALAAGTFLDDDGEDRYLAVVIAHPEGEPAWVTWQVRPGRDGATGPVDRIEREFTVPKGTPVGVVARRDDGGRIEVRLFTSGWVPGVWEELCRMNRPRQAACGA
jgi:hypothetical protein